MVILNGNVFEDGAPEVSLLNRSFKYGDGLFETMRVFKGKILFLEQHFLRLRHGMGILGLAYEPSLFFILLEKELYRAIELNGAEQQARLRLHVYRAGTGAYAPLDDSPYYLIEAYALKQDGLQQPYSVSLGFFPQLALGYTPLSACKTASALPYVLAARYAKTQGWDDALIMGVGGIAESSAANVFLIKNKRISTPPLTSGCLPGVMRGVVMQLAQQMRIPFQEKNISLRDVRQADEVFLTNSIKGIQSVNAISERKKPLHSFSLTQFLQNSLYQYLETLV